MTGLRDIRLIAAVGRSGQIGVHGKMPWYDSEDLRWFKSVTLWNVVIMGSRTARAVGTLPQRHVVPWSGQEPAQFLAELAAAEKPKWCGPSPVIWIAGGAHTYKAFMPFVKRCVVTLIDYDGPADAWMPRLWERRHGR